MSADIQRASTPGATETLPTDEQILAYAREFALNRFNSVPVYKWNFRDDEDISDLEFDELEKLVYSIRRAIITERNEEEREWYVTIDAQPEYQPVEIFLVDQLGDGGTLRCQYHGE